MVDWTLARQIARFAAGSAPVPDLGADLAELSREAEGWVSGYTRLELATPAPVAEVLDRASWAEVNVGMVASLLEPVGERLEARMSAAGPLAGALRVAAGATLAAETGLVVGYMAQRVLGQYELSLLEPDEPARLLFVAPNLEKAMVELELDRASFLGWVAVHEVTHVFQFSGVPWLRAHIASLLREYLATVDVRIEGGAAGGLPSLPDPREFVERFREGGLAALVQTQEQREIMDRIQAVMAVIEGYSEHVMDAIGEQVLPAYAGLREAMDRRRASRSAPERLLQRLLGFDLKMRQYVLGKGFCDTVVERHGLPLLNRVWSAPEALPTLAELERPEAWAERVAREPAPA